MVRDFFIGRGRIKKSSVAGGPLPGPLTIAQVIADPDRTKLEISCAVCLTPKGENVSFKWGIVGYKPLRFLKP